MSVLPNPLPLKVLDGEYAVHKLAEWQDVPLHAMQSGFSSVVVMNEEITLICPATVAVKATHSSNSWCVIRVDALLDHSLVGVLAGISSVLAEEKVSIFALSSWETDYILVQSDQLDLACRALEIAGHPLSIGPNSVKIF